MNLVEAMSRSEIEYVASTLETRFAKYYKNRNSWRRILIYWDCMKLRSEGVSYERISKQLSNSYDVLVRQSSVVNWTTRYHPLGRNVIPTANKGVAYFLGSGLGDGASSIPQARVVFQNLRDLDFATSIKISVDCLSWIRKGRDDRHFNLTVANKILAELLKVAKDTPSVLLTFLRSSLPIARAAISGFFDADGSVGRMVVAGVINERIQELFSNLLTFCGIHHTVTVHKMSPVMTSPLDGRQYHRSSVDLHELSIRHCCTNKYASEVGFRIKRKQQKLESLIHSTRFRSVCEPTVNA